MRMRIPPGTYLRGFPGAEGHDQAMFRCLSCWFDFFVPQNTLYGIDQGWPVRMQCFLCQKSELYTDAAKYIANQRGHIASSTKVRRPRTTDNSPLFGGLSTDGREELDGSEGDGRERS